MRTGGGYRGPGAGRPVVPGPVAPGHSASCDCRARQGVSQPTIARQRVSQLPSTRRRLVRKGAGVERDAAGTRDRGLAVA